jgi:hypothetical protein
MEADCEMQRAPRHVEADATFVPRLVRAGHEELLVGASEEGRTILYLLAVCLCRPDEVSLVLADDVDGNQSYPAEEITGIFAVIGFALGGQTMTMSADGMTIVGLLRAGGYASTSR